MMKICSTCTHNNRISEYVGSVRSYAVKFRSCVFIVGGGIGHQVLRRRGRQSEGRLLSWEAIHHLQRGGNKSPGMEMFTVETIIGHLKLNPSNL